MALHRIAILGWGSLIWDPRPDFDHYLKPWITGGPRLPLEYCRKSSSRKNSLTLVIDSKLGTQLETFYALSKRSDPEDAICDPRCRENTKSKYIGFVNLVTAEQRGSDTKVVEVIKEWAKAKDIQVAIWTDLRSSFSELELSKFFAAAFVHLKSLDQDGLREVVKYIILTPKQIDTRFRKLLMKDQWFKHQVSLFNLDA